GPRRTALRRMDEVMQSAPTSTAEMRLRWAVAHELNTPLCSILMNAEALEAAASDMSGGEVAHMALAIQRGARWLQSMIDNLLTHGRVAAGLGSIHIKPAQLSDLVKDVIQLVEPFTARKRQ